VDVLFDGPGGIEQTLGTISWIAAEAQFTPKLVQTREERVNLVYAVRVRVPNPDGALKIGMPGEFRLQGQ
jgi:membrane fusion protein YbhG